MGRTALLTIGLLLLPEPASAQLGQEVSMSPETELSARVRGNRIEGGPPLEVLDSSRKLEDIEIDGQIDEADWETARIFSGFTQREPVEGGPAQQDTEVRVLFGDDAIWIAARMWDTEPGAIDRRLTRRDGHGTFDNFSVHLDPNLDGLTGYRFSVSAANVQSDTYFYNDDEMDGAWNAVWSSATHVDEHGWSVELRIPLSQIRYQASEDPQTWGINFHRLRIASNERSYYSLVSRTRKGIVSQMGRIENVQVYRPARRLEVLPYAVSSLERGPAVEGDPFFDGSAAGSRMGVDISYGLGAAFTLDATINPDFGQVEADPAVINLSAFEVFFPEQRPFFVEDARNFDFGLSGGRNSLFYSRRIGRSPQGRTPSDVEFSDVPQNATILGAAKLAGRTSSGLSVGAMTAITGNEFGKGLYASGSQGEFLVEPQTTYGVFSLGQDFNEGTTQIRGLGTVMNRDLPADGSFDWLTANAFDAGVRFEHQWNDRDWALWGFFAGSHVRGSEAAMTRVQRSSTHFLQRPDATRFSVDENATSLSGRDWRLQLDKRNGTHWTGSIWAAEVSDVFEVGDIGFSTNAERLDGGFRVGYREIQPGEYFQDYNFTLSSFHNWSHEALDDTWSIDSWHNARTNGNYSLRANAKLTNWWDVRASARYEPQKMSRRDTRGGPMMVGPAKVSWNAHVNTDWRKSVSIGFDYDQSDDRIGRGGRRQIRANFNVRPSDNLSLSFNPSYEVSKSGNQYVTATSMLPYDPTFGSRYIFSDLDRNTVSMQTRLNWTFSPTLTLELFVQPLLSSGDYVAYKQLSESQTFDFDTFMPGATDEQPAGVFCSSSICETVSESGTTYQNVDFNGDGQADYSFRDRDFNVRSLVGNAVLRWEYRPGSTIFFVWQRNQYGSSQRGDFDFDRDFAGLWSAPSENRFIVKVNYWLGL
jgi:hypothetical protein